MSSKSKKKCKDDEILNPESNRCVKRTGPTGKKILENLKKKAIGKKPCKEDEIRNPDTNRCVKRTGSIGRKILDNQKKSIIKSVIRRQSKRRRQSKSKIICEKGKILNPKTKRCVNINGPIGRRIMDKNNSLKKIIKEIIKTENIETTGDIKRILKQKEILFNDIDLKQIIIDVLNENLRDIVGEIIEKGDLDTITMRDIKKELKRRNIDYNKDELKEIILELIE